MEVGIANFQCPTGIGFCPCWCGAYYRSSERNEGGGYPNIISHLEDKETEEGVMISNDVENQEEVRKKEKGA